MLQTIEAILQECAKRGMKSDVHISVHRFTHNGKVPMDADGHEFVDHLVSQLDGHKRVFAGSVTWENRQLGTDIRLTVFVEKPTISIPIDEYNEMKERLERLEAERKEIATSATQPEMSEDEVDAK